MALPGGLLVASFFFLVILGETHLFVTMGFRDLFVNIGLNRLESELQKSDHNRVKVKTAKAINKWALDQEGIEEDDLPFPFVDRQDKTPGNNWVVGDWQYLVTRGCRRFWVTHRPTGMRAKWLNSKGSPMEVIMGK